MAFRIPHPASRPPAQEDGGASNAGASGGGATRFRFSFSGVDRYRRRREGPGGPPLFRRWEAVGLLLLVTVGAAFVPAGGPAAATLLMQAAAEGYGPARMFSFAPPLLALLLAFRASGRLVRPFTRLTQVALVAVLSAIAVFLAFHIGLYLALVAGSADPSLRMDLILRTVPGAVAGLGIILVVAAIRLLARRAARELAAARKVLHVNGNENG